MQPQILPLVAAGAVMAAVILTGLAILVGSWAVRLLRVPSDPPEETAFDPPSPAPVAAGDPAAARARAEVFLAAAARGAMAREAVVRSQACRELATWIAACMPGRATEANTAAFSAGEAAGRARAAFAAGDEPALQAAALAVATAAGRVDRLADGLPDWRAAERRKLLGLTAALVAAMALAAVAMWLS